jgi:hypothetical protein
MSVAPQAPAAGGLVALVAGDLELARVLEAVERGDAPPADEHEFFDSLCDDDEPRQTWDDTRRVLLINAAEDALERAGVAKGSTSENDLGRLVNAVLARRAAAARAARRDATRRRLLAVRITEWVVEPASPALLRAPCRPAPRARARARRARAPSRRRARARSPGRLSTDDDDPEPEPLDAPARAAA